MSRISLTLEPRQALDIQLSEKARVKAFVNVNGVEVEISSILNYKSCLPCRRTTLTTNPARSRLFHPRRDCVHRSTIRSREVQTLPVKSQHKTFRSHETLQWISKSFTCKAQNCSFSSSLAFAVDMIPSGFEYCPDHDAKRWNKFRFRSRESSVLHASTVNRKKISLTAAFRA